MLNSEELQRASRVAEACLNIVRGALTGVEVDHDSGLVNDPDRHEYLELEARRLRGVFYNLKFLAEGFDFKYLLNDAYMAMMKAEDRAKKTAWTDPRWDEYMSEARCRSSVFFALCAAHAGDYSKVLDEINHTFLN